MLEQISNLFYDPLVFWGAPLVLVASWAAVGRLGAWWRRRR